MRRQAPALLARGLALAALLATLLTTSAAQADEALWKLVAGGGQVLFVRHSETTPGTGDPPGFRLEDCASQRNLSDEGRAHARRLGEALARRKVPLGEVLASPWCRCMDTATLAFGRTRAWQPLSNLFGRQDNAIGQVRAMRARIAAHRGAHNLVLVSHGSTGAALSGEYLSMGEVLVLTPAGDGFRVAGRLSIP